MDVEVLLFLIVGVVSVGAAVMMLLDDNAVQSALFLILNFACVAFLYLMLDAAFLALVQVAVYAGAIMVLFLFVIMLLGAEQIAGGGLRQFKWITPIVMTLAVSFLIATFAVVQSSDTEERETTDTTTPIVRIAYVAPEFLPNVDVFMNGELAVSDIAFREFSDWVEFEPGDYQVSFGSPGSSASNAIPTSVTVSVNPGTATTIVAYNEGSAAPQISTVVEDLSYIEDREGRLLVFNAYAGAEAVNIVNPGSDFRFDTIEEAAAAPVYMSELSYLSVSEVLLVDEGQVRAAVVPADPAQADEIILRLNELEVEKGTSTLVVLGTTAPDEEAESGIPFALVSATETSNQFGSPEAVGELLFVDYVLPLQMVAMLLLAAMVGAIILTQRAELKPKPGRPTRRKVSRPLTSVISSQTGSEVSTANTAIEASEQPEPAGD